MFTVPDKFETGKITCLLNLIVFEENLDREIT